MRRFLSKVTTASCLLVWLGSYAFAQGSTIPADEEFTQHYQAGVSFYEAGWFLASAERLQAAYRLRQVPALLINIGQAFRKAGLYQQAINYYERFFESEPNLTSDAKTEVEGFIKQAQANLSIEKIQGSSDKSKLRHFEYGIYFEGSGGPTPTITSHSDPAASQSVPGNGLLGSSHSILQAGGGGYLSYHGIVKMGVGIRGGRLIADTGAGNPTVIDIIIPETCISTGHAALQWTSYIALTGAQGCLKPLVSYIRGQGEIGLGQTHTIAGWGGGIEGQIAPFGLRFGPSAHGAILQTFIGSGIRFFPKSIETPPGTVNSVGGELKDARNLRISGYLSIGVRLAFESVLARLH